MARKRQGRFLGLPYDWRGPRRDAPERRGVVVPKRFGWGYTLNFGAIARRLRGR